ncbi:hypothetical protein [Paenibacillus durus]|uniref:Iron-dependent peroxidase n=1 Tax=Paenibacillus durus ATCC 35681 TaxID=1333534 RepID=A0A0F7FCG8_PAEDU|nr:hypothetical protein [Paenibacillus durus]AKG36025.1 iron-dependent peroxidase [Paenibacillus durus ATCC 35681]
MNYIWDVVMRIRNLQADAADIRFVPAETYSPYMELSLPELNAVLPGQMLEINPYYRFYDIFRDLYAPDLTGDEELRDTLFDLLMHFLAEIDLYQGMNRREYYIRFVRRDIASGLFGGRIREYFSRLEREEQETVAEGILRLYETGEAVHLFKEMMKRLFPGSVIYANCEEKDELLIYVGREEDEAARIRVELILELFLPPRFQTELYWSRHFGVLGTESTMRMDAIALY